MSGEGTAKFNRVAGGLTPGVLALASGIISGCTQLKKKDGSTPEWSVALSTSLSLAPIIFSFPSDKAMELWRKNKCNSYINSFDYGLNSVRQTRQSLDAIRTLPEAVWHAGQRKKNLWSFAGAAGSLSGLFLLQAIAGHPVTALYSCAWAGSVGAFAGIVLGLLLPERRTLADAVDLYLDAVDACYDLSKDEVKAQVADFRKLAEDVCSVPSRNPQYMLAAVGAGSAASFVAGVAIGQSQDQLGLGTGAYLNQFLPLAGGLLLTLAKCSAELLCSQFPGELTYMKWTQSFRQLIGIFMRFGPRVTACCRPRLGFDTPVLDVASAC